jgi:hypothetical protein
VEGEGVVDPVEGHEQGGAASLRTVEEGVGLSSAIVMVLLYDGAGMERRRRWSSNREIDGPSGWGDGGLDRSLWVMAVW